MEVFGVIYIFKEKDKIENVSETTVEIFLKLRILERKRVDDVFKVLFYPSTSGLVFTQH